MGKKEASKYSSESKPVLVQESKLFESIREFSPSLKKPILILFISLFVISSLSLILFFNYDNIVGEASYEAVYEENKDLVADKALVDKAIFDETVLDPCLYSEKECNDGIDNDCDGTCDYQYGNDSNSKICSINETACDFNISDVNIMFRDPQCDSCWDDTEEDLDGDGDADFEDGTDFYIPGAGSHTPGGSSGGDTGTIVFDPGFTGTPPGQLKIPPGGFEVDDPPSYPLHDCWNNTDVISTLDISLSEHNMGWGFSSDFGFANDFNMTFELCDSDGDCYINTSNEFCNESLIFNFNNNQGLIDCDDVYIDENPYCGPGPHISGYCDNSSRSTCAYCINPGADENACNDGVDNDCNEEVDCEDGFCVGELGPDNETCEATETICDDGFDNDADGSTDCLDDDCQENLACVEDCNFDFDNSTTYDSSDVTIFNYMVPALNNASCGDENQSICLTSLGYSWVCDEGDYYSVNPFNDNDGDNITFAEGDEDDGYGGIIC